MTEAHEHLAADYLGVYQLLWLLRGSDFDLSDDDAIDISRKIAGELVASGQAQLVLLRWPTGPRVTGAVCATVVALIL
ncbi:hypothetical protein V7968_05710 [Nocardia vulneris]|uniref:hypothetical protein n=1 Tax=Nocardia vulneris TaxID=1141657 RepID=UPI0030D312F8